MADPANQQLTSDLARALVTQLAPKEAPLFRAVSAAYFKDPSRVEAAGGKDAELGFGDSNAITLITPIVLAVTNAVVSAVSTELNAQPGSGVLQRLFGKPDVAAGAWRAQSVLAGANTRRTAVRDLLVAQFSLAELKSLCFDLRIDYEEIAGDAKGDKVIELIGFCERHGRFDDLVRAAAQARPDAAFPATAAGVATLSPEVLTRVRATALSTALKMNLPVDRAALLADALVGSLMQA